MIDMPNRAMLNQEVLGIGHKVFHVAFYISSPLELLKNGTYSLHNFSLRIWLTRSKAYQA